MKCHFTLQLARVINILFPLTITQYSVKLADNENKENKLTHKLSSFKSTS